MATIPSSFFSHPSLNTLLKYHKPTHLPCPNLSQSNPIPKFPRLGISYKKGKAAKQVFPIVISSFVEDNSKHEPEESISFQGGRIDLKLPRRRLLVQFTCDACGVRSERLINRLAYEKGMVFVQCTGCLQYHNLVDNLNLVVEYKFRDEIDEEQV